MNVFDNVNNRVDLENADKGTYETLFELAISLRVGDTIDETAKTALVSYTRCLNLSGGAVVRAPYDYGTPVDDSFDVIAEVPRDSLLEEYINRVETEGLADLYERTVVEEGEFSYSVEQRDQQIVCMELPDFGFIALYVDSDRVLKDVLGPLTLINRKFAEICRRTYSDMEIKEENNRFSKMIDEVPHPTFTVERKDGTFYVNSANKQFRTSFGNWTGYPIDEIDSKLFDVGELEDTVAEDPLIFDEETRTTRQLNELESELSGEFWYDTDDGFRYYRIMTEVLEFGDASELLCMFFDITQEKEQELYYDQLYNSLEVVFSIEDYAGVCRNAVQIVSEFTSGCVIELALYDRGEDALVPVKVLDQSRSKQNSVGFDNTDSRKETTVRDNSEFIDPSNEDFIWDVFQDSTIMMFRASQRGDVDISNKWASDVVSYSLGDHGVCNIYPVEGEGDILADDNFMLLVGSLLTEALDQVEREQGLNDINYLVDSLISSDTIEEIFVRAISVMEETFDFPMTGVWEYDELDRSFVMRACSDQLNEAVIDDGVAEINLATSGCFSEMFEEGGISIKSRDSISELMGSNEKLVFEDDIQSIMLSSISEYGVIATFSESDTFSESEEIVFETLAVSVENAINFVMQQKQLMVLDQVLGRVLRHNFRNTINIVSGYGDLLADDDVSIDQVVAGNKIMKAVYRLKSIVESARELRSVVDSYDEMVEVDLPKILRRAAAKVRSDYEFANIDITVGDQRLEEGNVCVLANPKLGTVFEHLIENAIVHHQNVNVFSPTETIEGKPPNVSINLQLEDEHVVVDIVDDGPGIPQEEIETLDEYEEEAVKHGSGVGLYIVDRILDYSGAEMDFCESNSDGSRSCVRLLFAWENG